MIDIPYAMFMAESEGLLDTRESAINRIIKEIKEYPDDSISNLIFYSICEDCGITAGTLSDEEMERISRAVGY